MTTFYRLHDAIESKINSTNVFILSNEQIKKDGQVGRKYTVFPNFESFFKMRNKFKYCHEIIVDHKNNMPNIAGRLVFDFDIKYDNDVIVPKNFKNQIEKCIIDTINTFYIDINTDILKFVWSSCENTHKLSKHLTVKNMCFETWIPMIKTFYHLFSLLWDKEYDWIKSNKLIDFQIARKNGSLRMIGSKKIGGNLLKFDNDIFSLMDSLIRIYSENDKLNEQIVTNNNINLVKQNKVFENIPEKSEHVNTKTAKIFDNITEPKYDIQIYNKAFQMCNIILPGIFKINKISGNKMDISRIKKHKCLMSDRVHDNENSFIMVQKVGLIYQVRFGCYRYCNPKYKTYHIGNISVTDNQIIFIDSSFL